MLEKAVLGYPNLDKNGGRSWILRSRRRGRGGMPLNLKLLAIHLFVTLLFDLGVSTYIHV